MLRQLDEELHRIHYELHVIQKKYWRQEYNACKAHKNKRNFDAMYALLLRRQTELLLGGV